MNKQISKEMAYILGVWKGDGHITKNNNCFILKVKDYDFAKKTSEILSSFVKKTIEPKKIKYLNRIYWVVYCYSKGLINFMKNFDLNHIINMSDNVKYGFVKGFADSEGCVVITKYTTNTTIHREVFLSNTNYDILNLIKTILKTVGINSSIYTKKQDKRNKNWKICHLLRITGNNNLFSYYKKIGFSIKRKHSKLFELLKTYKNYNCLSKIGYEHLAVKQTNFYRLIRIDLEKDKIINMYKNGLNTNIIAMKFNCSVPTIIDRLKSELGNNYRIYRKITSRKNKTICGFCSKELYKYKIYRINFCDIKCKSSWFSQNKISPNFNLDKFYDLSNEKITI